MGWWHRRRRRSSDGSLGKSPLLVVLRFISSSKHHPQARCTIPSTMDKRLWEKSWLIVLAEKSYISKNLRCGLILGPLVDSGLSSNDFYKFSAIFIDFEIWF